MTVATTAARSLFAARLFEIEEVESWEPETGAHLGTEVTERELRPLPYAVAADSALEALETFAALEAEPWAEPNTRFLSVTVDAYKVRLTGAKVWGHRELRVVPA